MIENCALFCWVQAFNIDMAGTEGKIELRMAEVSLGDYKKGVTASVGMFIPAPANSFSNDWQGYYDKLVVKAKLWPRSLGTVTLLALVPILLSYPFMTQPPTGYDYY
jgi:hypothetical protein